LIIYLISKRKYNKFLEGENLKFDGDKIPGFHHQYTRKKLVHNIYVLVYLLEKGLYNFIIDFKLGVPSDKPKCKLDMDIINKFIYDTIGVSDKKSFRFDSEFLYPKNHFELTQPNIEKLGIQFQPGTKRDKIELELSGLRYKSSGPVNSIIIDTYPQDYSYISMQSSLNSIYSFDIILGHFKLHCSLANSIFKKVSKI